MANTNIVKIRKRLLGFKRVPTLIEIGNFKDFDSMYYAFRISPITKDTKLLLLTITDEKGFRLSHTVYSKLGINQGSRKDTSLVILLADLVLDSKVKITYPKGTLSSHYKITLELVRAGHNVVTYKLLVDDSFYAYLNLAYRGIDHLSYDSLGVDNSFSDGTMEALGIIYTLLLRTYNGERELIALCEQLHSYYSRTLYKNLRSENFLR